MANQDERFDGMFLNIAQQSQGIDPLLDHLFSFLRRKTDFFSGATAQMTEDTVLKTMRKHAALSEKNALEKKKAMEKEDSRRKERAAKKKEVLLPFEPYVYHLPDIMCPISGRACVEKEARRSCGCQEEGGCP